MEDWKKENIRLEKKYYPITWDVNDGLNYKIGYDYGCVMFDKRDTI